VKSDFGTRDSDLKSIDSRMVKLQNTLKEYIDLIEVINEKTSLQGDAIAETR